jgi:hypothetical protein
MRRAIVCSYGSYLDASKRAVHFVAIKSMVSSGFQHSYSLDHLIS